MRTMIHTAAVLGFLAVAVSAANAQPAATPSKSLVELINQHRHDAGLKLLTVNSALTKAAASEAKALTLSSSLSTGIHHALPSQAVKDAGYKGTFEGYVVDRGQRSAEAVVKVWMGNASQKARLLDANATQIGHGVADHNGTRYWVVFFGHPHSSVVKVDPNAKITPNGTADSVIKNLPAPPVAGYNPSLNSKVLAFAQANMGKQVGNGECWTLADQALLAAGAKRPGSGGLGLYQFGQPVSTSTNPSASLLKPGDIVQFEGVKVVDGNSWSELSHHTAIVVSMQGTRVTLIDQNENFQKWVQTQTIDLSKVTQGTYQGFHPQPQ